MKKNSIDVFNYVMEHEKENITAKDIAKALDLTDRQVNGIITASFQRHKEEVPGSEEKVVVPLMVRVEGEIEKADGTHDKVKFIQMTKEGREFEPVED